MSQLISIILNERRNRNGTLKTQRYHPAPLCTFSWYVVKETWASIHSQILTKIDTVQELRIYRWGCRGVEERRIW